MKTSADALDVLLQLPVYETGRGAVAVAATIASQWQVQPAADDQIYRRVTRDIRQIDGQTNGLGAASRTEGKQ